MSPRCTSLPGVLLVHLAAPAGSTISVRLASTTVALPSAPVLATMAGSRPAWPYRPRRCSARAAASSPAPTDLLLHAVPAVAVVVQQQAVAHRLVGGGLQGRIDRGSDVVALVDHVTAEAGDHFLAHQLGHVRGIDLHRRLMRGGVHRHGLGRVGLGLADELQVGHALQHIVVTTLAGALRVGDRVARGGELGDAGQRGHLVQSSSLSFLP